MRFYHAFFLATIAISTIAARATKSSKGSIEWNSCPRYTATSVNPLSSASGSSSSEDAECAVYNAPLCHPGVCETPEGVDPTIEVFVKRLPATVGNPETARNVWLLQGGPGVSTVPMESTMVNLHARLEGAVNVYLMDHRGTGRSTRLSCSAATATNSSLWTSEVEPAKVGACAQELATKYGDLSSFSTTSAATDVAYFIGEHTNGEDTIVFGWSYGTALGERLIHLDPPEVTGYVLDGIASSSGAATDEFPYYSNWDTDFGEVADRFLALCEQDKQIGARFKKKGLSGTTKHLIAKLDRAPDSACAVIINGLFNNTSNVSDSEPPSFALRRALGTMLLDVDLRKLVPLVVYRLNRCADRDIDVLHQVVQVLNESINTKIEDNTYQSLLLFNLIIYSEMWEMPSPSMSTIKKRFTDVLISDTGIYTSTELYCAYSKEQSRACNKFHFGNYDANPIIYERDEYWNKSAVIPSQASVLLLSSKLDGQTPHKYAEYLLGSLKGNNKELITFEYATHVAVLSTPLVPDDPESVTCGMELLVSYIKNGNLKNLDKSCLDKMPGFNMTIATDYLHGYLLTADAYDGEFDVSLFPQSGEVRASSSV